MSCQTSSMKELKFLTNFVTDMRIGSFSTSPAPLKCRVDRCNTSWTRYDSLLITPKGVSEVERGEGNYCLIPGFSEPVGGRTVNHSLRTFFIPVAADRKNQTVGHVGADKPETIIYLSRSPSSSHCTSGLSPTASKRVHSWGSRV